MDHMEKIEVAPEERSIDFRVLRVTKYNRTVWVIIANISFPDDFAKVDVEILTNLMQGNEFKRQPYTIPLQPLCQFWKTIYKDQLYDALKTTSNLPAPEDCPPTEREFWIKDYVFNEENTNLPPHMEFGKWRLDMVFKKDGKVSGGLNFYVNSVKA